jgi:hypothetical protein
MRFRSVTSLATMILASLSLSFASLAATPQVAHADEDPATRLPLVPTPAREGSDAPATTRVFYGWQNLGVDAASIALLAVSMDTDDDGAGKVGASLALGGYLFGSPIVHAMHGNTGRALGSFALRLGVPIALGALTWAVEDHPSCEGTEDVLCGLGAAVMPVYMGILGAGAVMLIDDFGMAHAEQPAAPVWTPTVQASRGGMTFGLAGTF